MNSQDAPASSDVKFPKKKSPKEKYLSVDVHVSMKEVKTGSGWGKCLIPGPVTPMGLAICKGSRGDKANISDRGFGAPTKSAVIRALANTELFIYSKKGNNDKLLEHVGCTGIPHLPWQVLGILCTF